MATQVKTWSTNETLTASDLNAEFSNVYTNMADLSSAQEFTGQKTFGADAFVKNGFGLTLGHTAQLTVSTGDGATDLTPEFQVLGTGQADSTTLLGAFSTTATRAAAPTLGLLKSGNATIGSNTIVTDGEILGSIIAYGDDGTDYESPAAAIEFAVDGTPGTGDMPGEINFYTTSDGGETLTKRGGFRASGAFEIGVDDTGYDVKFFGATSGKYWQWDESADEMYVVGTATVGTLTPGTSGDGTLHVHTASAGSVTANAVADDFVIEGSTTPGMSILSPNNTTGYIAFGDPDNNAAGQFYYDHSNTWFQIRAEDAIWRFDSDGTFLMSNLSTEALKVVDAGSTSATEQDWIEVTVGGNTGYIRVFATK